MESLNQIEEELRKLEPASLPRTLLDRLDDAMNSAADQVAAPEEKVIIASSDTELSNLEESLGRLVPYGMPEDMISRLDDAMARWHEEVPVEEKVVAMPVAKPDQSTHESSSWFGLRSVAAVALLGAGLAFYTGGQTPASQAGSAERIPVLASDENRRDTPVVFTPADARASLISANDHGVVWTKNGQAIRCVEVHVNNRVQFVGDHGEKLTVDQPKREVRFAPVKLD